MPEEDYDMIDQFFSSTFAELETRVTSWGSLETKDAQALEAYFSAVHKDYVSLRDHISNYQYAIPTGMFSRYQ